MRALLRADGTREDFAGPLGMDAISTLIGAETCDTVNLHHMGRPLHVMAVDDSGWATEQVKSDGVLYLVPVRALRPINAQATELYLKNCQPGTTHQIAGDVFVCPDSDFGESYEC